MITTLPQKVLAILMSTLLFATTIPPVAAAPQDQNQQAQSPDDQQDQNAAPDDDYAPLTADELDGVVAPIALYPDALVAQVLGAASFPDQITTAAFWLRDNPNLKGDALLKAVDQQDWDPAVKALTQFPTVLDTLAKNLAWTSTLGEAATTQQADVMAAIQRMRAKAQAAGNLKSSPEIKVIQEAPQTIVIQPANPQIVYVPQYNPTVIYGAPVVVPGYTAGDIVAASIISFGAGIAIGAMINNSCCGWGWSSWGTSWHSHTIVYRRNVYYGNPYWRGGGRYPGYRPGYPSYGRPPYYRPPGGRPPYRPPTGGRPPGNGRPPYKPGTPGRPPGGKPGQPGTRPPGNKPGRPTIQSVPGPGGKPGTRPAPQPKPSTQPNRGYPQNNARPAKPNAFSSGGRPASERGNQSLGNSGGNRGGNSGGGGGANRGGGKSGGGGGGKSGGKNK